MATSSADAALDSIFRFFREWTTTTLPDATIVVSVRADGDVAAYHMAAWNMLWQHSMRSWANGLEFKRSRNGLRGEQRVIVAPWDQFPAWDALRAAAERFRAMTVEQINAKLQPAAVVISDLGEVAADGPGGRRLELDVVLHPMKLLVVGATGRLGRHVWRQALLEGHKVTVLVRSRGKLAEDTQRVEGRSPQALGLIVAEAPSGVVADPGALDAALRGQDGVISTLSQVGEDGETLYRMTRALITRVVQAGVRRLIITGGGGALSRRTPDGPLLFDEIEVFRRNKRLYEVQRQHVANFATLCTQDREKLAQHLQIGKLLRIRARRLRHLRRALKKAATQAI